MNSLRFVDYSRYNCIFLIGPLFAKLGIHTYIGFAFFGLLVVHVALNWLCPQAHTVSFFRKS